MLFLYLEIPVSQVVAGWDSILEEIQYMIMLFVYFL